MKSLAIAATGMNAQQPNVEVIANNIANINTTSFKRARAEFTDLFYQMDRMQGVPNRGGDVADPGRRQSRPRRPLGCGPQAAHPGRADADRQHLRPRDQRPRLVPDRWVRTTRRSTPAPARSTPTPTASSSRWTATRRSRDHGAAGNGRGHRQPDRPGLRQAGQRKSSRGRSASSPSPTSPTRPASSRSAAISIGRPRRPARRSSASPAIPATARSTSTISRASNVDPVKEITELISAQRAYEMNSKVIQASDEMAQTISKGLR